MKYTPGSHANPTNELPCSSALLKHFLTQKHENDRGRQLSYDDHAKQFASHHNRFSAASKTSRQLEQPRQPVWVATPPAEHYYSAGRRKLLEAHLEKFLTIALKPHKANAVPHARLVFKAKVPVGWKHCHGDLAYLLKLVDSLVGWLVGCLVLA